MKKIFIFLFVISVMICCIGCGKKATYKETRTAFSASG